MPEPPPPPPLPADLPKGSAEVVVLGGLLEGRVSDSGAVRQAVAEVNRLGPVSAQVEVEGGRFSVLFDEVPRPGSGFADSERERLVAVLQEAVQSSPDPGLVESTLRCTEVFAEQVVETLFMVDEGQLVARSRLRPRTPSDEQLGRPNRLLPPTRVDRWRTAAIAVLFVAGAGLVAWQAGWIEPMIATPIEQLIIDEGRFDDLLHVTLDDGQFGYYQVSIERGAGYPRTPEEVVAYEESATTTAARAAVDAVASGDRIYVRLHDTEDQLLAVRSMELRGLLEAERPLVMLLRARAGAARVELALDDGGGWLR